jgi:hypothetical protein
LQHLVCHRAASSSLPVLVVSFGSLACRSMGLIPCLRRKRICGFLENGEAS